MLVLHAKDNDYSLPLAYYHTTQPVFKTSEAPDLLFGALVRTSITEALFFSRKYAEHTRRLLFQKLVSTVLEDQALGGARLKELVGLPLDSFEEAWFHKYLTEGEGTKLKGASTAVETRQIITGRHRGQIRIRGMEDNAHGAKSTPSARAPRWSVPYSFPFAISTLSSIRIMNYAHIRSFHLSSTRTLFMGPMSVSSSLMSDGIPFSHVCLSSSVMDGWLTVFLDLMGQSLRAIDVYLDGIGS